MARGVSGACRTAAAPSSQAKSWHPAQAAIPRSRSSARASPTPVAIRKLTQGGVNPVVQRASTVIVESAAKLFEPGGWTYGRHGTATHEALKQALCEIEGAEHCLPRALRPDGVRHPLPRLRRSGQPRPDHRHCLQARPGVSPIACCRAGAARRLTLIPRSAAAIADLIRPDTELIFAESPGSMTFEVSDAPAIAAAARAAGAVSVMDNTWSAGVFHEPLDLGFDVSVQANTKYVSGGADALDGAIHVDAETLYGKLKDAAADLGVNVAPDDAYAILRRRPALALRMAQHETSALEVARWLDKHPKVARVLHPALESDPGHALWKRDFTGSSGLFGIELHTAPTAKVHAFLDALKLFGLGFSYGGFESLVIHCNPQLKRTASSTVFDSPLIRLSVGLEDPTDLIADLAQAFDQI